MPGVKELFASKKKNEEEENLAASYYKKFLNHGPAYYGDLDEADGKLLEYEAGAEERGGIKTPFGLLRGANGVLVVDWAEAYAHLRESLDLDTDEPIPELQRHHQGQGTLPVVDSSIPRSSDDPTQPKRKHPPEEDVKMGDASSTPGETSKRSKKDGVPQLSKQPATGVDVNGDSPAAVHARAAAAYIPFLTAEMLMPPKMPTTEETEKLLLDLRKKALVDEYFGDEGS